MNLVRKTVEETLNALLNEEASELVGAERYERTAGREAYRSGHYARKLVTGAEEIELWPPPFSYLAERGAARLHQYAAEAERAAQARAQDLRGLRLSRIEGRDAAALGKLPTLADLYSHRNVTFVGPSGLGKTHLAQAYGCDCCMRGLKTYYIQATELRDMFQKAVQRGNTLRVVSRSSSRGASAWTRWEDASTMKQRNDLFFDTVDRRYEKEGPNAMILTSSIAPSGWDDFFTGDDTLSCTLDRLFNKASAFVMRGPSYRGSGLDTYSVEVAPQAVKVKGIQPEGMWESGRNVIDGGVLVKMGRPGLINPGRLYLAKLFRRYQ